MRTRRWMLLFARRFFRHFPVGRVVGFFPKDLHLSFQVLPFQGIRVNEDGEPGPFSLFFKIAFETARIPIGRRLM